jgi:inosine/xanthosine triphosphate pyrophosphatase family protein
MRFLDIINENRFLGYKLVTSNKNKLQEYKRFGLNIQIEPGLDLREIDGGDIDVVIHKAKDAGPLHIVEDTSLNIEGENIGVNIRWMLDNLRKLQGRKASWVVLIGVNTGTAIEVYKGEIKGIISSSEIENQGNSFGFDPFFVPNGSSDTLAQLEKKGKKDQYSARKFAIMNMLAGKIIHKINISDIQKWTGEYQH